MRSPGLDCKEIVGNTTVNRIRQITTIFKRQIKPILIECLVLYCLPLLFVSASSVAQLSMIKPVQSEVVTSLPIGEDWTDEGAETGRCNFPERK